MRFYTIESAGEVRVAVANAAGDALLDLSEADGRLPADPKEFIAAGPPALARARALLAEAPAKRFFATKGAVLRAPVPRPGKILCSGINYRSHLEENPSATLPSEPFFFAKMPSTVIGPGEAIRLPRRSQQVDYEIEFAVVIGARTEGMAEADALAHVFGYTLLHDVSARDVQFKDNQITLGKNFDTFCPLGPCVVTPDELVDPAAVGMTLMLVGGNFDLSVGAMASMIGVITGALMKRWGWPVPAAVVTGLLLAALGGLLNGIIVAKVRVNALITTLGTMGVFQGIALLIGGPGIVYLPASFAAVGQAELLGIQMPVWILAALAVAAHFAMSQTRFFRQFYYLGSNAKAAQLSGLNVERLQVLSFTIMGVLAGVAGILYASRIATASSTVGVGADLQAITAVILGGASLSGGRGTIWGAMIGVFFMALMKNVLIIARLSSEWQGIVLGSVLVAAVALDSLMNRRGTGRS